MKTLFILIAWLVAIGAAWVLFSILLYTHRKLKTRFWYWYITSALSFPFDYLRFKWRVKGLTDRDLIRRANTLHCCVHTWFVMAMLDVIYEEIRKRNQNLHI